MDFAKELKSQVDIVKIVSQYVRLKKSGTGRRYLGLCPFHVEKTGSFYVHGEEQFYKCFGCGVGGDVFKFVMEIDRLTFVEALKSIADGAGIAMPARHEYHDPESRVREVLMAIHQVAAERFACNLRTGAGTQARQYLAKRGLSQSTCEEFGIGFSDSSGQDLVRILHQRFGDEHLDVSGLVSPRQDGSGYFDRFRNRLTFPIHDEAGKVIGFGGRALSEEDQPKYLNSPETALYKKSYVLYNLHRAKQAIHKAEQLVLVEGYMDVIGVWSGGVQNVIASCGTALTQTQVRAAKRHASHTVVNFDPDAAGANATEKSIQLLLDEGMSVRVLSLTEGLDPDEFVKKNGAEAYLHRLNTAPGYFIWLADRARQKHDMRTADGRIAAFKFLLPSVQRISGRLERAAVADEVAAYLNLDRNLVLDEFRKAAVTRQEPRKAPAPQAQFTAADRNLVRSLIYNPEVRALLLAPLIEARTEGSDPLRLLLPALARLAEQQQEFTFEEFEGRLDEPGRALLHRALFEPGANEETMSREQAEAYLRILKGDWKQAQLSKFRNRIREAERAGDHQETIRLLTELDSFQRS